MVFSSLIFLCVFLPLVIIGYFLMPQKVKNLFLLLVSWFFYTWGNSIYVVVLWISILINYITALAIQKADAKVNWRRIALVAGIVLNLGMLFYFKYFNFAIDNLNHFFNAGLPNATIILPIGISFFTFEGLSYIIDVYKRRVKADKNLFHIALYISLFPQITSGPIIKYRDISAQLVNHKASVASFAEGIQRFILGLGKKVLIANVLGQTADKIFTAAATGIDTPTAWLGILCYTLQIYFDFSGYSDMAIGLGRMFGFKYMENFNYPYISKSITEFWRRWHISLSTWFRDYLYIPLGGNRTGNVYLNLLIVFCVTGIWHGAAWNFIAWGLLHGIFIVLERVLIKRNLYDKIPALIRWVYTIFVLMMSWVLFRAAGFSAAWQYFGYLFGWLKTGALQFTFAYYLDARLIAVLIVAIIASLPWLTSLMRRYKDSIAVGVLQIPVLLALLVFCIVFIVNSSYSPFIYFQF